MISKYGGAFDSRVAFWLTSFLEPRLAAVYPERDCVGPHFAFKHIAPLHVCAGATFDIIESRLDRSMQGTQQSNTNGIFIA